MHGGNDIHIIIVNRDTRTYLENLLDHLSSALNDTAIRITVVDNDSRDRSADMVSRKYPRVHLIRNATNSSYGSACNQAAATCSAHWLVFLNSDVVIDLKSIQSIVDYMAEHQDIGLAVPAVWTYNPEYKFLSSCLKPPTVALSILENTVMSRWIRYSRIARAYRKIDWQMWTGLDNPVDIPATPGSIMFIRSSLFDSLSGWDPRFISGYDDIDLCVRIRKSGFRIVRVPGIFATHFFAQGRKRYQETNETDWHADRWSDPYYSPELYLRKHYGKYAGRFFRKTIEMDLHLKSAVHRSWKNTSPPNPRIISEARSINLSCKIPEGTYFLEISLSRSFLVSMARSFNGGICVLPEQLLRQFLPRKHYARIFHANCSPCPPSPIWAGAFHPCDAI